MQIAAADCVVGKIGYGTASECLAHGVPLVFQRRDFFNEEAFLRKLLEASGWVGGLLRRGCMAAAAPRQPASWRQRLGILFLLRCKANAMLRPVTWSTS